MSDYLKLAREAREAAELLTPLSPPSMQAMLDVRINAFAVQLLAESWAKHSAAKEGSLCFAWNGIEITLGPNKLREVNAALCDAIEAQAAELAHVHAKLDELMALRDSPLVETLKAQAAEIERLKSGREFIIRGGCAHQDAYLIAGERQLRDDEEVRVREVKP